MKKKIFRSATVKTLREITKLVNDLEIKQEDLVVIIKEVEQYVLFYWQEE